MSRSSSYPERVLELFRAAPGAGPPDGPGWCTGEAVEVLTQTRLRVHLRVGADGEILAARYEVRGCPYTVAAAALWAEQCVGMAVSGLELDPRGLLESLGAPTTKLSRILTVEDAYRQAALLACRTCD